MARRKSSLMLDEELANPTAQATMSSLLMKESTISNLSETSNFNDGGNFDMALSFNRLMDSGTFFLNTTTATGLSGDLSKIIGKAVTFTGNDEVGYGSADQPLAGIVTKAEYGSNVSDKIVVTVEWKGTFENIAASGVTAGDGVTVDGTGGLQKATSGLVRGVCTAFDSSVATILM